MARNLIDRSNFWLTTGVGSFLVVLVIALGLSFFKAIFNAQIESRKEFLTKQTELAARGLETELNRFEEESRFLLIYLEEPGLDEEDFREEFTLATRRTFTTFPQLIDTIWVDLKDSVLLFTLTERNDFFRLRSSSGFPTGLRENQILVEGDSGFRVLYSTNFQEFSREYVTNFYLDPGGEKFLFFKSDLLNLNVQANSSSIRLAEGDLAEIKNDIDLGIKGFYEVTWDLAGEKVNGIIAQYPFSFGPSSLLSSLVFILPVESLTSGIYSTYLFLFVGIAILMIGTVAFFIISLKGSVDSVKIQEANMMEISRLFEQQNLLLKELKGFVFFHDFKGEITKVSNEVEEVLGHSKAEFIAAFKSESKHPEANKIKEQTIKALSENTEFLDFEYDYLKPSGEKIRVRVFEKLIFDEAGRFSGGMGICTDVTRQYLSRQEIIQSENRLRTLINNIPDTIFIYDNEGTVLDFHVQDKKNLLEPAQYTLGKNLEEFVPHGQADEVLRVFHLARNTNKIQTTDVIWHSPRGNRHFEMRFFPLDDNQVMSISKDVTSQKIWEKGLVEAMKAADQASRAKSEFLANMSHEIRTPMNGLLGIIDLLESTNLNKIQKQYLEIIKNSGNSLLNIIKDILDYSKIESGKIEIQNTVFNPVSELKNQIEILSGIAQKKQITVEVDYASFESISLESDKGKINQVLLNLIGNALKFTPDKGTVRVKMDLKPVDESLFFLQYQIEDTGIGISKEHLEHLTDPFYQVESSNSRTYQGTGLGLAIAKKIIELLGGELEIRSETGKGSVFGFSVLVKKARPIDQIQETEALTWRDIKEMGTVFPLRILLAEDNDLNLQLMKLMFQQLGFEFEVAKNGAEVLEKIKIQDFDVILMDVQMPVMNGLEATRAIRAMKSKEELIIIGLSANVFEDDQNKALDAGMNDYLTKPIRLAALADKLEFYYRKVREREG